MLFVKELKRGICSLTFILYVFVVVAMYQTQFVNDNDEMAQPPIEGEDYGSVVKEIPEVVMPTATEALKKEYESGVFTAYPVGFYKEVKLSEKEDTRMQDVLKELSGEIAYERFRELMREVDDIIGGGSAYSDEYLLDNFSRVPMTYEDALRIYDDFMKKDKITGAYGRLFCDYLGIVLSVFPVFVAVTLVYSDTKAGMTHLIYAKQVSSIKLVVIRYLALCVAMIIPVVLAAIHAHVMVVGMYPDYETGFWGIYGYAGTWLIPNIMLSTAMGMLMTELTTPLIAVVVQCGLWLISVFSGIGALVGSLGKFALLIRHNSLGGREKFMQNLENYIFNRSFWCVVSIMLVMLTVIIYEKKRRGRSGAIVKTGKNRIYKSKA